jgi:formate-dependent nitrite reductase membrane component NrfD
MRRQIINTFLKFNYSPFLKASALSNDLQYFSLIHCNSSKAIVAWPLVHKIMPRRYHICNSYCLHTMHVCATKIANFFDRYKLFLLSNFLLRSHFSEENRKQTNTASSDLVLLLMLILCVVMLGVVLSKRARE